VPLTTELLLTQINAPSDVPSRCTIRDTLGSPNLGIPRELAIPTTWGTITSLLTKLEEFGSKEVVTPQGLSNEISKCEARLRSQLEGRVKEIADTKGASVEAQLAELKSTLLQSVKVIQARCIGSDKTTVEYLDWSPSLKRCDCKHPTDTPKPILRISRRGSGDLKSSCKTTPSSRS
jgi:hypothetical protein